MSLILKISDTSFTDATLPLLQRDSVIDAGSKFVFDFADPYCFAKQAAPVNNDQFVNLVGGGNPATTVLSGSNSLTFAGGGIGFDIENNSEQINLPVAGNLPANNLGFVFCTWIKHQTQADSNFNAVAGYANQVGANCQYGIAAQNTSNTYRMYAQGNYAPIAFPAAGAIMQLGVAVVKVGANMVLRAYSAGVQVGSDLVLGAVAGFSLNQVPSANMASAALGFMSGFSGTWVGSIYRTWLNDTGTTGVDPLTLIAKDWADNSGRFS